MFVVRRLLRRRADLRARRPAGLPLGHARASSASYDRFDPASYYANVREVLDLVDAHTEPGRWRDTLKTHWYRGKMLSRVGGLGWRRRDERWRRELFEDDPQARAGALRRGRPRPARVQPADAVAAHARRELRAAGADGPLREPAAAAHPGARHRARRHPSRAAARVADGTEKARLRFERHGDRVIWMPATDDLKEAIPEADRDVTGLLRKATVERVAAQRRRRERVPPPRAHRGQGRARRHARAPAPAADHHRPDRAHRRRRGRPAAARHVGGAHRGLDRRLRAHGDPLEERGAGARDDLRRRGGSSSAARRRRPRRSSTASTGGCRPR